VSPALFLTLAFAIGVVAGLRTMTALMVVSWAARLRWVDLNGTWVAFLGGPVVPLVFTLLAAGELFTDQLPSTPSRKTPVAFAARVVSGAFSGAALATGVGEGPALGALFGALGAVVGTLGGYALRTGLVRALKVPDRAVAVPEDIVAVVGGFVVVAFVFFYR
jgi:uncharacterized membrane protein